MSEHGAENDALRETLIDFARWSGDDLESAEWAAETYLNERQTLSLAVTRQSPSGKSLTYCCCDRTTARLVVCPVHPEARVTPPAECHACRIAACEIEGNPAAPHTCVALPAEQGRS